jgi:hypothetical protein
LTRYAIYRVLYGEDFIKESIKSIINYFDKIFIVLADKPLAEAKGCIYKGKYIEFPKTIDNVNDEIKKIKNEKIIVVNDYVYNNSNQFTHIVNDLVLPNYTKPDCILFIEHDHIFKTEQIESSILEFEEKDSICLGTRQVELWKTPFYRIPERNGRLSCVFWNMKKLDKIPTTGRHANSPDLIFMNKSFVHNFGFCMSEKNMLWKHLVGLGISSKIGDCQPNELWYEKKWLNWDFEKNNSDLEISIGSESDIPNAMPYNTEWLPEVIREKYRV